MSRPPRHDPRRNPAKLTDEEMLRAKGLELALMLSRASGDNPAVIAAALAEATAMLAAFTGRSGGPMRDRAEALCLEITSKLVELLQLSAMSSPEGGVQ